LGNKIPFAIDTKTYREWSTYASDTCQFKIVDSTNMQVLCAEPARVNTYDSMEQAQKPC